LEFSSSQYSRRGVDLTNQFENKGRIGIISGSGPEAGIDLWKKILDANRRLLGPRFHGDLEAPDVTIYSIPELGLSMDLERNEDLVWTYLESNIRELAHRADIICVACNTLHYFSERIVRLKLPVKFVSVVDSVADYVKQNRIYKLAILGVCSVVELGKWSPYNTLQSLVQIERPDCRKIEEIVFRIKQSGSNDPSVKAALRSILIGLESETALLACTELSLVRFEEAPRRIIDGTTLLANDVVRLSLSRRGYKDLNQDVAY
jgi:aspartate racemase